MLEGNFRCGVFVNAHFCNFCVSFSLSGRLGVGSRRNFIIRMKCGQIEDDLDEADSRMNEIKIRCKEKRKTYDGEDYAFIHCTGYVPVKETFLT